MGTTTVQSHKTYKTSHFPPHIPIHIKTTLYLFPKHPSPSLSICTHLKLKFLFIQKRVAVNYSQESSAPSFRATWMVWICCDTADNILSSSRLNSSKQPQAPTWQRPTKIRPQAYENKSKETITITGFSG